MPAVIIILIGGIRLVMFCWQGLEEPFPCVMSVLFMLVVVLSSRPVPEDCLFYGEITPNGDLVGPRTLNGMELELARREPHIRRCVSRQAGGRLSHMMILAAELHGTLCITHIP